MTQKAPRPDGGTRKTDTRTFGKGMASAMLFCGEKRSWMRFHPSGAGGHGSLVKRELSAKLSPMV